MSDPFAVALDALFSGPGSAAAVYSPQIGNQIAIRVIRHQGTRETALNGDAFLEDVNSVQIRRADVPEPFAADMLTIDGTDFVLQGGGSMDVEGLTWTCPIEPAN